MEIQTNTSHRLLNQRYINQPPKLDHERNDRSCLIHWLTTGHRKDKIVNELLKNQVIDESLNIINRDFLFPLLEKEVVFDIVQELFKRRTVKTKETGKDKGFSFQISIAELYAELGGLRGDIKGVEIVGSTALWLLRKMIPTLLKHIGLSDLEDVWTPEEMQQWETLPADFDIRFYLAENSDPKVFVNGVKNILANRIPWNRIDQDKFSYFHMNGLLNLKHKNSLKNCFSMLAFGDRVQESCDVICAKRLKRLCLFTADDFQWEIKSILDLILQKIFNLYANTSSGDHPGPKPWDCKLGRACNSVKNFDLNDPAFKGRISLLENEILAGKHLNLIQAKSATGSCMRPVIYKMTGFIRADNPEEINASGWELFISALAKGRRPCEDELVKILLAKVIGWIKKKNKNIANELLGRLKKVLQNHHKNHPSAAFAITFNACISLSHEFEHLLPGIWKEMYPLFRSLPDLLINKINSLFINQVPFDQILALLNFESFLVHANLLKTVGYCSDLIIYNHRLAIQIAIGESRVPLPLHPLQALQTLSLSQNVHISNELEKITKKLLKKDLGHLFFLFSSEIEMQASNLLREHSPTLQFMGCFLLLCCKHQNGILKEGAFLEWAVSLAKLQGEDYVYYAYQIWKNLRPNNEQNGEFYKAISTSRPDLALEMLTKTSRVNDHHLNAIISIYCKIQSEKLLAKFKEDVVSQSAIILSKKKNISKITSIQILGQLCSLCGEFLKAKKFEGFVGGLEIALQSEIQPTLSENISKFQLTLDPLYQCILSLKSKECIDPRMSAFFFETYVSELINLDDELLFGKYFNLLKELNGIEFKLNFSLNKMLNICTDLEKSKNSYVKNFWDFISSGNLLSTGECHREIDQLIQSNLDFFVIAAWKKIRDFLLKSDSDIDILESLEIIQTNQSKFNLHISKFLSDLKVESRHQINDPKPFQEAVYRLLSDKNSVIGKLGCAIALTLGNDKTCFLSGACNEWVIACARLGYDVYPLGKKLNITGAEKARLIEAIAYTKPDEALKVLELEQNNVGKLLERSLKSILKAFHRNQHMDMAMDSVLHIIKKHICKVDQDLLETLIWFVDTLLQKGRSDQAIEFLLALHPEESISNLSPHLLRWWKEVVGKPKYETYWQFIKNHKISFSLNLEDLLEMIKLYHQFELTEDYFSHLFNIPISSKYNSEYVKILNAIKPGFAKKTYGDGFFGKILFLFKDTCSLREYVLGLFGKEEAVNFLQRVIKNVPAKENKRFCSLLEAYTYIPFLAKEEPLFKSQMCFLRELNGPLPSDICAYANIKKSAKEFSTTGFETVLNFLLGIGPEEAIHAIVHRHPLLMEMKPEIMKRAYNKILSGILERSKSENKVRDIKNFRIIVQSNVLPKSKSIFDEITKNILLKLLDILKQTKDRQECYAEAFTILSLCRIDLTFEAILLELMDSMHINTNDEYYFQNVETLLNVTLDCLKKYHAYKICDHFINALVCSNRFEGIFSFVVKVSDLNKYDIKKFLTKDICNDLDKERFTQFCANIDLTFEQLVLLFKLDRDFIPFEQSEKVMDALHWFALYCYKAMKIESFTNILTFMAKNTFENNRDKLQFFWFYWLKQLLKVPQRGYYIVLLWLPNPTIFPLFLSKIEEESVKEFFYEVLNKIYQLNIEDSLLYGRTALITILWKSRSKLPLQVQDQIQQIIFRWVKGLIEYGITLDLDDEQMEEYLWLSEKQKFDLNIEVIEKNIENSVIEISRIKSIYQKHSQFCHDSISYKRYFLNGIDLLLKEKNEFDAICDAIRDIHSLMTFEYFVYLNTVEPETTKEYIEKCYQIAINFNRDLAQAPFWRRKIDLGINPTVSNTIIDSIKDLGINSIDFRSFQNLDKDELLYFLTSIESKKNLRQDDVAELIHHLRMIYVYEDSNIYLLVSRILRKFYDQMQDWECSIHDVSLCWSYGLQLLARTNSDLPLYILKNFSRFKGIFDVKNDHHFLLNAFLFLTESLFLSFKDEIVFREHIDLLMIANQGISDSQDNPEPQGSWSSQRHLFSLHIKINLNMMELMCEPNLIFFDNILDIFNQLSFVYFSESSFKQLFYIFKNMLDLSNQQTDCLNKTAKLSKIIHSSQTLRAKCLCNRLHSFQLVEALKKEGSLQPISEACELISHELDYLTEITPEHFDIFESVILQGIALNYQYLFNILTKIICRLTFLTMSKEKLIKIWKVFLVRTINGADNKSSIYYFFLDALYPIREIFTDFLEFVIMDLKGEFYKAPKQYADFLGVMFWNQLQGIFKKSKNRDIDLKSHLEDAEVLISAKIKNLFKLQKIRPRDTLNYSSKKAIDCHLGIDIYELQALFYQRIMSEGKDEHLQEIHLKIIFNDVTKILNILSEFADSRAKKLEQELFKTFSTAKIFILNKYFCEKHKKWCETFRM